MTFKSEQSLKTIRNCLQNNLPVAVIIYLLTVSWLFVLCVSCCSFSFTQGLYAPWLHAHEHPPELEFSLRQDGGYDE